MLSLNPSILTRVWRLPVLGLFVAALFTAAVLVNALPFDRQIHIRQSLSLCRQLLENPCQHFPSTGFRGVSVIVTARICKPSVARSPGDA